MLKIIKHPIVEIILRVLLGGIFIFAAIAKILDGPSSILTYVLSLNIAPAVFINAVILSLPYIELALGYGILLGLFTRVTAGLALVLTLVFLYVNIIGILQGIEVSCHCFGIFLGFSNSIDLIINILMIGVALYIIWLYKYNKKLKLETWINSLVKGH
jgi:uncharacterized membrane protein YphA (DoxX/SURF4 family)